VVHIYHSLVILHQVGELRREVAEVKDQLRSQKELTAELNLLVEQRAARIVHLDKLLQRKTSYNGVKVRH